MRRDDGRSIVMNRATLDNRFVVPYNSILLHKFQAHINVEKCNQSRQLSICSSTQVKETTGWLWVSLIKMAIGSVHRRSMKFSSTSIVDIYLPAKLHGGHLAFLFITATTC